MISSRREKVAFAAANMRKTATKDCLNERPDGRKYRSARWLGLFLPYPVWDVGDESTQAPEPLVLFVYLVFQLLHALPCLLLRYLF